MPRTNPTTKLDVVGNLDPVPEKDVAAFIESKQSNKNFLKPPVSDATCNDLETIFLQNEREFQDMCFQQKLLLEEKIQLAELNANRIRRSSKSENNLRRRFIEVNSFVRDFQEKKREAEKKINDELATQKDLNKIIEKQNRSLNELTEFREQLRATVRDYSPYERILEEVVEESDIYDSVKDCIHRCDALMLAQVEISKLEEEKLEEIEEMRKRMIEMTNAAALEMLGLKNELAEMQRCYDTAKAECLKWEKLLVAGKNELCEKERNRERTLDGIYQIYRLLCRRRAIEAKYVRSDVEKVLDFIKDEVEILQVTLAILKKPVKKEAPSSPDQGC